MNTKTWMDLLETVGIPAAFAVAAGWMVWKLFNHLIADVHKKLDTQHGMIVALIDRIRQMDEFPERATGAMSATSIESPNPIGNISDMKRIRMLQDLVEPIIDEDGTEIQLTAGEVVNFSSLMADTLIAAGFAESAEI